MTDYVGKVVRVREGRLIKVEAFFYGNKEAFYLIRWTDTNEVFCEYSDKIEELFKQI